MDQLARLTSTIIKKLLDNKVLVVATGAGAVAGSLMLGPEGLLLVGLGLGVDQILMRIGLSPVLSQIVRLFPMFVNVIITRWEDVRTLLFNIANLLLGLFCGRQSSTRWQLQDGHGCSPRS